MKEASTRTYNGLTSFETWAKNRPLYKIPLKKDIDELPMNGYKVVSTFSGCGGACLGLRMAGFKVVWANEFISAARDTYSANYPDSYLDSRDIRKIKADEILEAINMKRGELDLYEGSPPCADFSMAGKRTGGEGRIKKYSDTHQQVDDLFFEYARILNELQPKMFIAENVKGLTLGDIGQNILGSEQTDMFGGHKKTIFHTLSNCGYKVRFKVLNSKNYGVPQSRERLILIGIRNDLDGVFVYPKMQSHIYTLRDAIEFIQLNPEDLADAKVKGKTLEIIAQLKPGQAGSDIMGKGSYFSLRRLKWDEPTGTVQQSEAKMASTNQIHPDENRRLTIPELKRVCGFPDDFILTGDYKKQWERLGRAVMPPLYANVGKSIKEVLDHAKIKVGGTVL